MANQKRKKRNIIRKLPEDIVKVIFSKLPFSNLPNCRIVCKAWNNLVLDYAKNSSSKSLNPNPIALFCLSDYVNNPNPKFHCIDFDTATNSVAKLRFHSNWNRVLDLSSCNGLLHIYKETSPFLKNIIWNPMTYEFFQLPGLVPNLYAFRLVFGFGFNPKTKQYKLFRAYIDGDIPICRLEVWRFGISEHWKDLCSKPFNIHGHGIYFDGVVYWLGKNPTNDEFVIYALDVETESFEVNAILDVGPYSSGYGYFQLFNDSICLIINMFELEEPIRKLQVWIMRAKHSWIKEFAIDLPNDFRFMKIHLIKVLEGERTFIFLENNDLFYFNKSREKIKIETLFNPHERKIESIFHMETFHFGSLLKILAGND